MHKSGDAMLFGRRESEGKYWIFTEKISTRKTEVLTFKFVTNKLASVCLLFMIQKEYHLMTEDVIEFAR